MLAAGKTAAVSGGPPDAQFNYVTLLLNGNGTNGAQNNTFLDSSTNNFTITRNGNTTQGTFSPYGQGWSNNFPTSPTTYMSVAGGSTLSLGTGDFTIEFWLNRRSLGAMRIFGWATADDTAFGSEINASNKIWFGGWNTGTYSTASISANVWTHIAMTRTGGVERLFINGTLDTSVTRSTNYSTTTDLQIGTWTGTTYYLGYLSNFRVVKGTALYTSSFTPSTTPLTAISGTQLLTCQSNSFIDNSTNNFALTVTGSPSVQRFSPFNPTSAYSTSTIGGSGYFDGTGDYLSAATNTAFAMGTGDFTMEAWVYATAAFPTYGGVVGAWSYGASSDVTLIIRNSTSTSGKLYVEINGTGYNGTAFVYLNQWTHIAVTRSGTTLKTFVNGAVDINTTNSANIASNYAMTVNGSSNGSSSAMITGYISDARVIKGTALYTSAFTPTTTPLTAISGTSLLCNMTNAGITDNSMMNDLETVGNAQVSTSVKKYGTGSLYFDGTGDYLYARSTVTDFLQLGVNGQKFTVEAWIYPTSAGVSGTIVERGGGGSGWTSTTGISWTFFQHSSNRVYFQWWTGSNNGSAYSGATLAANTWQHVAAVYDGTTTTVYINGTSSGGGTSTSAYGQPSATNQLRVGMECDGTVAFTGYIDDLRITKGYARYASDFTPPTAALPDRGS